MSGSEWVVSSQKYWKESDQKISALGRDVADILASVFAGIYHLDSKSLSKVKWSDETWMTLTLRDSPGLATHDGCQLADLVLLCFMLNVRLDIEGRANHYVRLIFSRVTRMGFFRDQHPMLDEAIQRNHHYLANIYKERESDRINE